MPAKTPDPGAAQNSVSASPATIDPHQIQGPRHEAWEAKVSAEDSTATVISLGQLPSAAISATASTGHT